MPQQNSSPQPTRRSVLASSAWAVPSIVIASAAPAFAASTTPEVNLWSRARLPLEARDGEYNGDNYYQGPRTLTFRYTYGNLGPDALPAGATISIGLPFSEIWDGPPSIVADPQGKSPTYFSTSAETIGTEPNLVRRWWNFQVPTTIGAGEQFTIDFRIDMNSTSNTATNFYKARPFADIRVGSAEATEAAANLGNNRSNADNYAFFNNKNATPNPTP